MSSQTSPSVPSFAFAKAAALVAAAAILSPATSFAQAASAAQPEPALPAGGSTSIQHDSEKARALTEPSYQTQEERLAAKPLDWTTTIGTPTPRVLSAEEKKALQRAKRSSSTSGRPNPKAEEEARKLHPDDWK